MTEKINPGMVYIQPHIFLSIEVFKSGV